MKRIMLSLVVLITLCFILPMQAHTPKNALGAVAIGSDGKTLAAGGDNRVLYVLDPASLEVKKRVWLKTNIFRMVFNKSGSVLVVEDTSETLHFIKTADWKVFKTVKKAGKFSAAPAADLMAGLASGYRKSTVKFISMSDGSLKGQIEFPGKVTSVGLDADGTRLVLMADGPKDKEAKNKTPKELKGLDKDIFKQKNDGKTSIIAEFEAPSGKKISEKTVFFSSSNCVTLVTGKKTLFLNYSNVNAAVAGDKITLFKSVSSFNYGIGISHDRKYFLLGGLRSGTLGNAETMDMKKFDINRLPGWPEYYKGFAFAADGAGYAVTTAYRLVKISKTGVVEKTVPIY